VPPANRHAGYTPATELKGLGYMARQMFEAEISAKEMHSIGFKASVRCVPAAPAESSGAITGGRRTSLASSCAGGRARPAYHTRTM